MPDSLETRTSAPRAAGRAAKLHAHVALATLLLIALAVGASTAWIARTVDIHLSASMAQQAGARAAHVARRLAAAIDSGDAEAASRTLEEELTDDHTAFIAVESRAFGAPLAAVRCAETWSIARESGAGDRGPVEIEAGVERSAVVAAKPVWTAESATPVAMVRVGVRFPQARALREALPRIAALTTAAVSLGALPIVLWSMRRVTGPLRRVADAAEALAELRRPDTLPEAGADELRSLSRSFNRMASRLLAAREAREAAYADLERTVAERTDELRRVNDLLKIEIKEKNEFLRTLSHDLGAPLRNIAGMTAMLVEKHGPQLPTDALTRLERIAENVRIESQMLTDLLELSSLSIRAGAAGEVDAGRMARDVVSTLEHDARAGQVEIEVAPNLPAVRVEPARLRIVLQNLVENAIKYMGPGPERTVRIRARAEHATAEFCVEDTGPGIPESEHERIFLAFRRGSTARPGVDGRGVGLAAVRAVVERWGGRIWLESERGRGSRFSFTAPLSRTHAAGPPQTAAGPTVAAPACPPQAGGREDHMTQRQPPRVLVLEDDPDAAALIGETVDDHFGGRSAVLAHRVAELSAIDVGALDIALCDYNLPDGTALDALRLLLERRDDLPIIVVTGERQVGTALDAIRAGAADYIVKVAEYLRVIPVALEKNLEFASVRRENVRLQNALASSLAQLKRKNAELEEAAARFERLASTDQLTGLANRRQLEQRLGGMFVEAQRYDADLACLMIDLDDFKAINDTLGHPQGDALLALTGRIIDGQIRDCDVGGRYGGDEFVIVLPRSNHEMAIALAQRLMGEFSRGLASIDLKGRRCGMSIGVASRRLSEPSTPGELIAHADHALYTAKVTGRSRIGVCGAGGGATLTDEAKAA